MIFYWFVSLSAVALILGLVLFAIQSRGITSTWLSRIALIAAWLLASFAAASYPEETATLRHRVVFGGITAILLGVILGGLELWMWSVTRNHVDEHERNDKSDQPIEIEPQVNVVALQPVASNVIEGPTTRVVDMITNTSSSNDHLLLGTGASMFGLAARFQNQPSDSFVVTPARDVQAQVYYFQGGSDAVLHSATSGLWQGRKGSSVTFGIGETKDLLLLLSQNGRLIFPSADFLPNGQRNAMHMNVDLDLEIYVRLFHRGGNQKGRTIGTFRYSVSWRTKGVFQIHGFWPEEIPSSKRI